MGMSENEKMNMTEAAVEAAAVAIFQNQTGMDWESRSDALKARFIDDACAALEAAAPHIHRASWNEGYTAAVAVRDFRAAL